MIPRDLRFYVVLAVVILLALVYQLCFRYVYLMGDGYVVRIDRLTGKPCTATFGGEPGEGLRLRTTAWSCGVLTSPSPEPSLSTP